MSTPASHLVLSVKDALREMRFAVRHEAGLLDRTIDALGGSLKARARSATADLPHLSRALTAIPTPGPPVLWLTDAVFGRLERAAVRALTPDRSAEGGALAPVPAWLAMEGQSRRLDEAAFVRRHYQLAHDVLRDLGAANLLLSEQAIGAACQVLETRHGDLLLALSSAPARGLSSTAKMQRIGFCAAQTLALERARPIRGLDLGSGPALTQHLLLAPNLYVFAVIGIATAVVSTAEDVAAADAMDAAKTVVDVRFARFGAALRTRDPLAALTREFQAVVPYLP